MQDDEIFKSLWENPDAFISKLENDGADFSKVPQEMDLARRMVKKRFYLTEQQIIAVEFVYWVSFLAEKELHRIIADCEVSAGARPTAIDSLLDKLHFGDKVKIMKELYISDPNDQFLKIYNKINDLRNAVAHGRYEALQYKGHELYDFKGQAKLIADFGRAAEGGKN